MELKLLNSFAAVVQYGSFTKAAEKTYISQPTISTHIRILEEDLQTHLIVRDTKNIKITPKGWELYECATHMLELQDNLLRRWSEETKNIIQLGASTIPSAYILPEVLPPYGKLHPDTTFIINQSDSSNVLKGLLGGLFDIGIVGMKCQSNALTCIPFYKDRMVLITPYNEHFLRLQKQDVSPTSILLEAPVILRENGSGSREIANQFLECMNICEDNLKIIARVNDQECIKNLVSGGLGVSIVSERAAKNFVEEKQLLMFDLGDNSAKRNLYIVFSKDISIHGPIQRFVEYVRSYYRV